MSNLSRPINSDGSAQKTARWYIYAVTLIASTGGFLFGYDLAIISGAGIFLRERFELTPTMFGLANSSAVFGCILGPLLGLWLADAIGRKYTLAVAAICFMVSALGSALCFGMADFVVWRALGGVGIGLAMVTSPMYIAELAPARLRGRLITINQLAIVFGINMAIVVAYFLSFEGHWRWMFASEVPPIMALMIGLLVAPRSPRWLAANADFGQAMTVLARINGRGAAEKILGEIKAELKQETGTFRELFLPGIRMALIIGVILMIFQQINGVNMILLYTPTILIEAGIGSPSSALLNSLYVNLCIFLCTLAAFWLVGRFGRRPILMVGVTAMAVGHLLLGLAFMLDLPLYIVMTSMLICTAAFTLSLAPLGWVVVAEIYPNRIRAKAISVVCFFLYSSSFICTQVFPMITDWFRTTFGNQGGAYWIFAGICFCCVIFCWRIIPETKDLTLEEISQFWLQHDKKTTKHGSA